MRYDEPRPYADAEKAARRLVEIASTGELVQDGRIHAKRSTGRFKAGPAEYSGGMELAIERGWRDAWERHLRAVHAGRRRAVSLRSPS